MLRAGLIWLSQHPGLFRFVRRNPVARRMAGRFVAGETFRDGVRAVQELNTAGISASLDLLGEAVTDPEHAREARDVYVETLDAIAAGGLDCNVSVKLTHMGLAIDEALCVDNMRAILGRARDRGNFVRIDMEQSIYVERTLRLYRECFRPEFGGAVGVVLQSALRRTAQDVEEMIALGSRVRLCKGAYREPPEVAFPRKRDVDKNYVACMERLLEHGTYPAIATHDPRMHAHAKDFVRRRGVPPDRWEFQMIYGVRRDLQQTLRDEGYRMRVSSSSPATCCASSADRRSGRLRGPPPGIARRDLVHHLRERGVERYLLGVGETDHDEQDVGELHLDRLLGLVGLLGLLAEAVVDLTGELADFLGEAGDIGERGEIALPIPADPAIHGVLGFAKAHGGPHLG
jgi:proline dehydrogenase